MRLTTSRCVLASLALAATVNLSAPALAQDADDGVVYAGGGVGDGRNVYAGAVVALPGASLGNGLAARAGISAGEYRYDANGERVSAAYRTLDFALVYQASGEWGWANFGAGPRLTYTDTDPEDPFNKREGNRVDAALTTDGAFGYRWRLGWYGSYGVRDEAYFTELRFSPLIDEASQTRVGIEGSIQGDETYTRGGAGLFASTALGRNWEGRLSSGFSEMAGRGAKPYAAFSLSHLF